MAKIQIKSEKLTPFGRIFSIMEQFDALLAQTIDSTLGLRCTLFGYQFCYQYSEILRSLDCSEKLPFSQRWENGKRLEIFFELFQYIASGGVLIHNFRMLMTELAPFHHSLILSGLWL